MHPTQRQCLLRSLSRDLIALARLQPKPSQESSTRPHSFSAPQPQLPRQVCRAGGPAPHGCTFCALSVHDCWMLQAHAVEPFCWVHHLWPDLVGCGRLG